MELTVFMTNEQANLYRYDDQFPSSYFDGELYAHYLNYDYTADHWYWTGWDNVGTISHKDLPQLTYDQLLSLPTPITIAEFKLLYPEFYI